MTPALMRAEKVAKKSGEYKELSTKEIIGNIQEMLQMISENPEDSTSNDFGRLLFDLSALASKLNIEPEKALFDTTNSFIEKFKE